MPGRSLFDPQTLPFAPDWADRIRLPAIAADRLTPAALRDRFGNADRISWSPERPERRLESVSRALRPAAVLVPIIDRPSGMTVLLTHRAAHLTDHAGQIAFPGGRCDPEDRDTTATALREAWEEISLEPDHVEPLGSMPDYVTGTGYTVTPVVALVHPPFSVTPSAREVAECFEVPLSFLMNPAHHEVRVFIPPAATSTGQTTGSGSATFSSSVRSFERTGGQGDATEAAGAVEVAEAAVAAAALSTAATGDSLTSSPGPIPVQSGERRFFSMPYPRDDGRGVHFIWGATAGMLRNLYRFLAA